MGEERIGAEVWTNTHGRGWEETVEELPVQFRPTAVTRIVFLEARELKQDDPVEDRSRTERRHAAMKDALGMPAAFWSSMLQDASGLFRAAEHRSNAGSLNSRETWLRLLIKHVAMVDEDAPGTASGMAKIKYEWHRLGMFGRWWSGGRFEVFCFDFPVGLRDQIKKQLPGDSYLLIGATGTVRMAVRTDRALVRSIGLEMPRHST